MDAGKVIIKTKLDTKSFDEQIKETEAKLNELEKNADESSLDKKYRRTAEEVRSLNAEIEKTRNKLVGLRKQQEKVNQEQRKMDGLNFSNISENVDNINKGLSKSVKKVTKWALAIFGVRSAYMAIRSAMSTLSQYDEQMSTNLKYIQYALANTLKPVIEWILNAVVKLLQYINYIANAWFGINLFASAQNFKDMEESANKTAKSTKEIKKQLASFDEMNVLSDTSSSESETGGITTPNIDLSSMQGEVPSWLKWIADNKDLLIDCFFGVAAGLLAWKLGFEGLQSLGIGLIIFGIVESIKGLIDYLQDPTWENFGKVLQGISIAILGIGLLIGSWPLAFAGAMGLIIATIIKYWDDIKDFFQNCIDWLAGKSEWVHEIFGDTIGSIYDLFVNSLQKGLDWADTFFTSIKKIFDGFIEFVTGIFTGDWQKAWDGLSNIVTGILDIIVGKFKFVFGVVTNIVEAAARGIAGIIKEVAEGGINAILMGIEFFLNAATSGVRLLSKGLNFITGGKVPELGTFSLGRVKLAKGGIINQPGRGIPVGKAYAGEAGMEGVLPLTDSQQMELLGKSIGKYVNLNATIPVYVGNRQIAREIKKINAEDNFAFNN